MTEHTTYWDTQNSIAYASIARTALLLSVLWHIYIYIQTLAAIIYLYTFVSKRNNFAIEFEFYVQWYKKWAQTANAQNNQYSGDPL